jgi:Papain family cysteine protease
MSIKVLCDLRTKFGNVRDQDQRPTCLAFAASDAHAALRSPWTPLSAEYAYYHAQRRAARPLHVGGTLPAMLDAVREDGQPAEAGCPYLVTVPANWKPTANVGPIYRRHGEAAAGTVTEIVRRLDGGRPVLVLMMLSGAFDIVDSSGVIDQRPGDQPNPHRRHAVVAVGHGLLASQKVVLIRNSWGDVWAEGGYAWLTESYLEPRVFKVGILTEDVDVSTRAAAA